MHTAKGATCRLLRWGQCCAVRAALSLQQLHGVISDQAVQQCINLAKARKLTAKAGRRLAQPLKGCVLIRVQSCLL